MSIVYLNGEFMQSSAARVAADDAALLRGEGLFETLRAADCRVCHLHRHLARLRRSAEILGLPLPAGLAEMPAIMRRLLTENALSDARCRITLSASGTLLATADPFEPYDADLYRTGAAVTWSRLRVNEQSPLAGHKITSYFANMLELRAARARGFLDALCLNNAGHLAEGCVSNVFLVRQGILLTPPLQSGCLPGIMRQLVLEQALPAGISCQERDVMPDEVEQCEEVFLTNALMGLMPVTRVDDVTIAAGKVGPLTRRLIEACATAS